ncbi:MAG: DNA polymerase III subunit beta [Planctomycetes bacterium]|nr:DNA polymerase III subunit beta [Planctomycetota bacterium]
MKTTLPRQDFQDALSAISTVTGGRTTKPILSCVKLRVAGEAAELSATDGEAALRTGVPCLTVDEPGELVVSADRMLSIVRELSDVEISLDADDRHCIIRGEGSEFKVFVLNPADFPPIPQFDDEPDLVIDGAQLWRMIGLTLYAAARETSRFAINGVLWEKSGRQLFLVATDGRRLARAGGTLAKNQSGDFQVIIPAKALNIFERVFGPGKDAGDWQVDVKVMPNQVLLRSGQRVLSTVLVEGHFPKYDDVIPKDNDKQARIGREEFHAAVRRAALLTTEDSRAVRLAFEAGRLVITSRSPEQGEARVELPIEYEQETVEIGFNPVFLNDVLRAVPYDELTFEFKESFRPGVLFGEDKNEFLYVLMPVSLSS